MFFVVVVVVGPFPPPGLWAESSAAIQKCLFIFTFVKQQDGDQQERETFFEGEQNVMYNSFPLFIFQKMRREGGTVTSTLSV